MNYWLVKLFKGEELYITPRDATALKAAIGQDKKFVTLQGNTIAIGNIASIEESERPFADTPLLETTVSTPDQPLFAPDGSAKVIWVKKEVSPKQWDSYYAKSPGYYRLNSLGSEIMVGFHKVITGESLPRHLEICSDNEMGYLDERSAR